MFGKFRHYTKLNKRAERKFRHIEAAVAGRHMLTNRGFVFRWLDERLKKSTYKTYVTNEE